jgi:hypothetical protein
LRADQVSWAPLIASPEPPAVAPTAVPAPCQPAASTAVTNPTPDAKLIEQYGRYGGRLRILTAQLRSQLPMADDSTTQLCLAYCLTRNCNSNCARHGMHRQLTNTEEGAVSGPSSQRVGRLRRHPQPMSCSPRHITAFQLPCGSPYHPHGRLSSPYHPSRRQQVASMEMDEPSFLSSFAAPRRDARPHHHDAGLLLTAQPR